MSIHIRVIARIYNFRPKAIFIDFGKSDLCFLLIGSREMKSTQLGILIATIVIGATDVPLNTVGKFFAVLIHCYLISENSAWIYKTGMRIRHTDIHWVDWIIARIHCSLQCISITNYSFYSFSKLLDLAIHFPQFVLCKKKTKNNQKPLFFSKFVQYRF